MIWWLNNSYQVKGMPLINTSGFSSPRPHVSKGGLLSAPLGSCRCACFSTSCLDKEDSQLDNVIIWSEDDLGGSMLTSSGMISSVQILLIYKPLHVPQVWGLLVQQCVCWFHCGLDTLNLYVCWLSSENSESKSFFKMGCGRDISSPSWKVVILLLLASCKGYHFSRLLSSS